MLQCNVPVAQLRAWVDNHYTRIAFRAKDTGTKLDALYTAYTTAVPPVHDRMLGRNKFAQQLNSAYPNIGPHMTSLPDRARVYLLR